MFLKEALTSVRSLTGVDKGEVTDEEAREMLPAILRQMDKLAGRLTSHTLTVVPGQSDYELPDPLILKITSHSYQQSQVRYGDTSYEVQTPKYDAGFGAHQQMLRSYESRLDEEVSSMEVLAGVIRVEPTPSARETVAFKATSLWSFVQRMTFTGDGAQEVFELAHRRPFGVQVMDAGEPLEEDEYTVSPGRPATVTCVVAPEEDGEVVITYYTASDFEQVPQHMRRGFTQLWAASIARLAGLERARQPELNFADTKIKQSGKGLLAAAQAFEQQGKGSLNTRRGMGMLIQ